MNDSEIREVEMPEKRCAKCKRPRPLGEFSKCRSKPDGLQTSCRECRKTRYKECCTEKWQQAHQKKAAKKHQLKAKGEKWCGKCGKSLSVVVFGACHRNKDGLQTQCKSCDAAYNVSHQTERIAYGKQYHKDHREQHKNYYVKNQKQIVVKTKQYRKDNPEKVRNMDLVNRKKYRATLRGYLRCRYNNTVTRCEYPGDIGYDQYGGAGVCVLFTFEEFYDHVVNDLGFDSVESLKGLHTHRIGNGNYCVGGIEFLTPKAHKAAHKILNQIT